MTQPIKSSNHKTITVIYSYPRRSGKQSEHAQQKHAREQKVGNSCFFYKIPPSFKHRMLDTLASLTQFTCNVKDGIMTEFEKTIEKIKSLISNGGGGSRWFAHAYVSWYRNGDSRLVSLSGVERLDSVNMQLFWQMINLRRNRDWCETTLYELERYAIEKWQMDNVN